MKKSNSSWFSSSQSRPSSTKSKNRKYILESKNSSKNINLIYNKSQYQLQGKSTIASPKNYNKMRNYSSLCKNFSIEREILNQEINSIQDFWNDLGIPSFYKDKFLNSFILIPENKKMEFLLIEKKNLNNFRDTLIKISKEITSREYNLKLLMKYNELETITDNLLKGINVIIKNLIINSINIINQFMKIREILNHYSINGNFDFSKMNVIYSYSYDPNYLLKMKKDMCFLENSPISKKIPINKKNLDAFIIDTNSKLKGIKISPHLIKAINRCRYILFEEAILSNMNNSNNINQMNFSCDNNFQNNPIIIENYKYLKGAPKKSFYTRNNNFCLSGNLSLQLSKLNNEMGEKFNNPFKNRKIFLRDKSENNYNISCNNIKYNEKNPIKIERDELPVMSGEELLSNIAELEKSTNINVNNVQSDRSEKEKFNKMIKEMKKIKAENKILKKKNQEYKKMLKYKIENFEINDKKKLLTIKELKQRNEEIEKNMKSEITKKEKLESENSELLTKLKKKMKKSKINFDKKNFSDNENNEDFNKIRYNNIVDDNFNHKKNNSDSFNNNNEKKCSKLLGYEQIDDEKEQIKNEPEKIIIVEELIKKQEDNKANKNEEMLDKKEQEEFFEGNQEKNYKINNEDSKEGINKKNKEEMEENLSKKEKISEKENEEKEEKEGNLIKKGENFEDEKEEKENKEKLYKKEENSEKEKKIYKELYNENEQKKEDKLYKKFKYNEYDKKENTEKELSPIKNVNVNEDYSDTQEHIISNIPSCRKGKYTVSFYNQNLLNFVNNLSSEIPLNKIYSPIRKFFNISDNIYKEDFYLKGIFPKIIISTNENKEISGFCFVYYEKYREKNLKLKIENVIVVEEDWEEQVISMMNTIKKNFEYDELFSVVNCETIGNDFNNNSIKNFFQNELGFSFRRLVSSNDKYIKLFINNDQNNIQNENVFNLNTITLLSINANNRFKVKFQEKYNVNKYINLLPIYIILNNVPGFKINYNEQNKKINLNELNNNLDGIINTSFNIEDFSQVKEIFNKTIEKYVNNHFEIDKSVTKEISDVFNNNNSIFNLTYDIFSMNIFFDLESLNTLKLENYYYNQIISNKIDILSDKKTNTYFYLIPTSSEDFFILLCQINEKLRNILINNNNNIYEKIIQLHPSLIDDLLRLSDIDLGLSNNKNINKNLYIPSFSIDSHLFSYNIPEINKNIEIIDRKEGTPGNISSFDEYIKIEFNKDKNVNNCFSMIPIEENEENAIFREPFIFGIFNRKIISLFKIPFLQLIYVTKENWIRCE